jgi:hypothetical protein
VFPQRFLPKNTNKKLARNIMCLGIFARENLLLASIETHSVSINALLKKISNPYKVEEIFCWNKADALIQPYKG